MSEKTPCSYCCGRFDRPGLHGCHDARHATPTLAQKIAAAIEYDLGDREGMEWDEIHEDDQQSIRDAWARIIEGIMDKEQPPMSDGWTVYDPPLSFNGNSTMFLDELLKPGMLLKILRYPGDRIGDTILVGDINDVGGGACNCPGGDFQVVASKRVWTHEDEPN